MIDLDGIDKLYKVSTEGVWTRDYTNNIFVRESRKEIGEIISTDDAEFIINAHNVHPALIRWAREAADLIAEFDLQLVVGWEKRKQMIEARNALLRRIGR